MNLYKILIEHCSPKDSVIATVGYILCDDREALYKWFETEPHFAGIFVHLGLFDEDERNKTTVEVYEDEEGRRETTYSYKDAWMKFGGDIFDPVNGIMDYDNLYYGKSLFGFEDLGEYTRGQLDMLDNVAELLILD